MALKINKSWKEPLPRLLLDGALFVLGSFLYAVSVNVFTAPNNIAPGGFTGIATLVNYLFGFPIGTFNLLLNIPFVLMGWRRIGTEFTIRTAIATALVSVMIDFTTIFLPPFQGDLILTALFGGILCGAGIGLIYMRGGTTGGSELIARLLQKRLPHIPAGRIILIVDVIVVAASAVVYRQIETALYATIFIFVSSMVMDTLIYGRDKGKMLLIISKDERQISREIMDKLGRGVTLLKALGAYTGTDKQVLMCAVRPSEVYMVRTLTYDIDPEAFIVVVNTEEVLGEGFKVLKR